MSKNKLFDLEAYARELCEKAGINPEKSLLIGVCQYSDSVAKYIEFLKVIIIQNWGRYYNMAEANPNTEYNEKSEILEHQDYYKHIPTKKDLIEYLNGIRKMQDYVTPSCNVKFSLRFYHALPDSANTLKHWIAFGEPGTGAEDIVDIWPRLYSHDYMPPCKVKTFECTGSNDEALLDDIFGHSASTLNKYYSDKKGEIEIISDLINNEKSTSSKTTKKSENLGIQRGVAIKNLQKAGKELRKAIIDYMTQGIYFRNGAETIFTGTCPMAYSIVGKITDQLFQDMQNLITSRKTDSTGIRKTYFPGLKEFTGEIPYSIFMQARTVENEEGYKGRLLFPLHLYQYWLSSVPWANNQEGMNEEIQEYSEKFRKTFRSREPFYIKTADKIKTARDINNNSAQMRDKLASEKNRATYIKLIELCDNDGFNKYMTEADPEPYTILDEDDVIYTPNIFYAALRFNKESRRWYLDGKTMSAASQNEILGYVKWEASYSFLKDGSSFSNMRESLSLANGTTADNPSLNNTVKSINHSNALNNYSCVRAEIRKIGRWEVATGKVEIVAHNGNAIPKKFRPRKSVFTFLLYLILEKEVHGHDWLSSIREPFNPLDDPAFRKINRWCQLGGDIDQCDWLNNNENRKDHCSAINHRLFKKPHKDQELISRTVMPDGSLPGVYSYQLMADTADIKFVE